MHSRRPVWLLLLLAALFAAPQIPLAAQESDAEAPAKRPEEPFAVVAVAGVERMMQALDFSFAAADRPEMSDVMGGYLANAGDLSGLDRNQAFGVMFFLAGITPEPVGFAPVEKIDDLMKTIEIGPFTTKKIDEENYEVKGRRNTIHVRLVGRYAFFSDQPRRLERVFPDPAPITDRLSAEYDIAAMINLDSLTQEKKDLLATLLRASADANLQRRDHEEESAHRVRKAVGENNARLMEQVLRESRSLTLGWKVMPQQRQAALELKLVATAGSELETILRELKTTKSQFSNLLQGDAPLTFASTWTLNKPSQEMFQEIVGAIESTIPAPDSDEVDAENDPVARLFRAARATVSAGQLDFALRFLGEPGGPFVFVSALKVADGRAMVEGLEELCLYWLESGNFEDVELNAEEYQGIRFHRLDMKEEGNDFDRLYGGTPSMFLGVGNDTLWVAVGGDQVVPRLFDEIDAVQKPVEPNRLSQPLQFVINVADWTSLGQEDDPRGPFGRAIRDAFTQDNATLRIDIQSIAEGARLRFLFDEGFIRFIGLRLARRFDGD